MLGLYVHVPFCQAICAYCNFNRGLLDDALKTRYVEALEREILEAGDGSAVDTIFFGGGTPSLLTAAEVARILAACRSAYDVVAGAEVTLEANPETIDAPRLARLRASGVNRLSIGVQSFDDGELRRLGRVHSAGRAIEAFQSARAAGFENLSLDLMLWLPGQSPDSWRRTLARAVDLAPDHLSIYLLELYPNAPLKDAMAREGGADWVQTSDDDAADMYLEGFAALDAAGYAQYEISNAAHPGREARHNLKYWQSGAWRGFGCGAHSTVGRHRWHNLASTADYVSRVNAGRSVALDVQQREEPAVISEALFTGLRLSAGINRQNFLARFGVDPWTRYRADLEPFVAEDMMWKTAHGFGLTRKGMLVANDILVTFV